MSYLKVINGKIYEADPHSSEGHGVKAPVYAEAWGETTFSGDHNKFSEALEGYRTQVANERALEDKIREQKAKMAYARAVQRAKIENQKEEMRRTQEYTEAMTRKAVQQGLHHKADFENQLLGNVLNASFGCTDCITEDQHRIHQYMMGNVDAIPKAFSAEEYRQKNLENKLIRAKAEQAKREAMLRRKK